MVSSRVDTGAIDGAARDVGRSGDRCAEDVARVAAAFGLVASGAMTGGLVGAAGTAGRQWSQAVLACTEAVGLMGGGLHLASRSYDQAEGSAAAGFGRRP